MKGRRFLVWEGVGLLGLLALALAAAPTQAQVLRTNLVSVDAKELSNVVQLTFAADGVLDWRYGRGYGSGDTDRINISFPGAQNAVGRTFIDVGIDPVSYVSIRVSEQAAARGGVGLEVQIVLSRKASVTVDSSDDKQKVFVQVKKPVTTGTVEVPGAAGAEAAERIQVSIKDGLLYVEAANADIHNLLAEIAQVAGVEIAVDDEVQHRVNITLPGLPVDQVMAAIAAGYGLSFENTEGVYRFSAGLAEQLSTYPLSETESFRLRYLTASEASRLLPLFILPYLRPNIAQNAMVITAPRQMLEKVREDLAKIDQPPPQIMIEVLVVELTDTGASELKAALNWQNAYTTATSDSGTGEITYSTVGALPRDFEAALKLLVDQGKARIRSNPRIAATNGKQARVFVGFTRFIQVEISYGGVIQRRIQSVDVGVELVITPWTGGNKEITTGFTTQVSNIRSLDPVTRLPTLTTRRAGTTVRTRDGDTVVIGGLTQAQEFVTRRKIPFFGDLPLVGPFFRSLSKDTKNTELLIFVTPRVLSEGHLPAAEEEATKERFLGKPTGEGASQAHGAESPPTGPAADTQSTPGAG